ncbi:hypothetical protein EV421DRAFT_1741406 [Armillaria borealis]|uniref:F-box domain-containing protein n=1 Tax=Armillaria borealis TaxID=47425 RepID=A0AA39J1F4_9AGAR|nr:hypothetical protein EV421DRAFT_1741406 [Armillaria borealis]
MSLAILDMITVTSRTRSLDPNCTENLPSRNSDDDLTPWTTTSDSDGDEVVPSQATPSAINRLPPEVLMHMFSLMSWGTDYYDVLDITHGPWLIGRIYQGQLGSLERLDLYAGKHPEPNDPETINNILKHAPSLTDVKLPLVVNPETLELKWDQLTRLSTFPGQTRDYLDILRRADQLVDLDSLSYLSGKFRNYFGGVHDICRVAPGLTELDIAIPNNVESETLFRGLIYSEGDENPLLPRLESLVVPINYTGLWSRGGILKEGSPISRLRAIIIRIQRPPGPSDAQLEKWMQLQREGLNVFLSVQVKDPAAARCSEQEVIAVPRNLQMSVESLAVARGRTSTIVTIAPSQNMLFCTCRNCGFINDLPPDGDHQLQAPLKAFQGSNNIVAQILRESRTILDPSENALISADILELERLQSFYDAQLQESHRYWYENQSSLGVDGPLWVLGRVCGFWRETLHTFPAPWAQNVVVRTPFPKHAREILWAYLQRTGEHPLTLQVIHDSNSESPERDVDEILSLFVQETCHRWKDVIIDVPARYMHCLEEFNYRSDICLKAPQLRCAMLDQQGISQVKLPPCITHYSGEIAHPDDVWLLQQPPKLRVCHLHLRDRVEPPSISSIRVPVVMPHVEYLFIKLDMLDLVTLPSLKSLVLPMQFGKPTTNVSACITHFFQRSRCHLTSLSIDGWIVAYSGPQSMKSLLPMRSLHFRSSKLNWVQQAAF